jgi:hypothetical protein
MVFLERKEQGRVVQESEGGFQLLVYVIYN